MTWNKGRAVGQKKPLTSDQIQTLKTHLSNQDSLRDLALFCFQIDTMLRSSDVIKLKVEDVRDIDGEIKREINIQQKKTRKPHIVALSEDTATIIENYITINKLTSWLFPGNKGSHIHYKTHWLLWKTWIRYLNEDPAEHGTHSGRRTRAKMIYDKTKDPKLVMEVLGQKDISSTTNYLGTSKKEALNYYKNEFLK